MSNTAHVRIYKSDKERLEQLQGDEPLPATIRELLNDAVSVPMTNRKNIKIAEETYELLREQKGQYQTWNGFLQDAFSEDE